MLSNGQISTEEIWRYLIGSTLCHFVQPLLDKEKWSRWLQRSSLHNVRGFNGTTMGRQSAKMFSTESRLRLSKMFLYLCILFSKHYRVRLLLHPSCSLKKQDRDFFLSKKNMWKWTKLKVGKWVLQNNRFWLTLTQVYIWHSTTCSLFWNHSPDLNLLMYIVMILIDASGRIIDGVLFFHWP